MVGQKTNKITHKSSIMALYVIYMLMTSESVPQTAESYHSTPSLIFPCESQLELLSLTNVSNQSNCWLPGLLSTCSSPILPRLRKRQLNFSTNKQTNKKTPNLQTNQGVSFIPPSLISCTQWFQQFLLILPSQCIWNLKHSRYIHACPYSASFYHLAQRLAVVDSRLSLFPLWGPSTW